MSVSISFLIFHIKNPALRERDFYRYGLTAQAICPHRYRKL